MRLVVLAVSALSLAMPAAAGYTHYWVWRAEPDPQSLVACVSDMRRIVAASTDVIRLDEDDCAGTNGPSLMCFNGVGDDSHESFIFPGETVKPPDEPPGLDGAFNFCKTGGGWPKPYDSAVTACLIAARDHFPADVLAIDSDGSWSDWSEGARLYELALSREASSPLTPLDEASAEAESAPTPATGLLTGALLTAAFLAGLVFVLFLALRGREAFAVSVRASDVRFRGSFPRARQEELASLLRSLVPPEGSATIRARRGSGGRLEYSRRGDIDDAGWQRVLNYLVNSVGSLPPSGGDPPGRGARRAATGTPS